MFLMIFFTLSFDLHNKYIFFGFLINVLRTLTSKTNNKNVRSMDPRPVKICIMDEILKVRQFIHSHLFSFIILKYI